MSNIPACCATDCIEPPFRHGRCETHYARLRQAVRTPLPHLPPVLSGSDSPVWKAGEAGYSALHGRLQRAKGFASEHACVDCHGPAAQWSYDHLDPSQRFSTAGLPFSTNLSHYRPRCARCHSHFDRPGKGVMA